MAYIITVANQKGGVAKTTTVVSVCGALAARGLKVLAVDLDSQADLTLALGVTPGNLHGSMADLLLAKSSPSEKTSTGSSLAGIIIETAIPGLHLAPATSEMDKVERFLSMRSDYLTVLKSALMAEEIQGSYDVVLLDCPPFLGVVTSSAMHASQLLVIPTQPEYNMMATIRTVRSAGNPDLVYRILITMQDRRNRIHRNLSEQIQATFGEGLLRTVIEVDTKLRESAIAGVPVNYYHAKTRSTQQYHDLAQELAQYVPSKAVEPA
jgi:chromosome partitioning protein